MTRRLIRSASAAVAICAMSAGLVACGDDEDDAVSSDDTTTSTSESTTSSSEASSTTASPTTESPPSSSAPPTSAADCIGTAEGATAESSASGDVDGDGAIDTLEVLHDAAGTWFVQVTLANGGSSYTQLPPTDNVGGMEMIGAADVDGDGKEEMFVQTGSGASKAIFGLFTVAGGCDITRVTLADGADAEFPVGASVGTIAGLQCSNVPEASSIIAFEGYGDGQSYEVASTEYELAGAVLTEIDSGTGTAGYGDELYVASSTFHCDDVTYGA
jgi:hypothetical protein